MLRCSWPLFPPCHHPASIALSCLGSFPTLANLLPSRYVPSNADIWLRRDFEMPAGNLSDLALLLHHDEDTEVYLNGVLAVKAGSYNAAYESFDVSPEAQAVLKPGRNLMAVHCRQTGGGQYIDLGLEAAVPK